MANVIIEATTANAMLITLDLHTANPPSMANLMASTATTTANHTANPPSMANLMASTATTTANPKLEKIIPPMVIPRSFPR